MTTTPAPSTTASYAPAAAIAAGVLAPSWLPRRVVGTVLAVAAARAWADEQTDPSTFYFFGVQDTGLLTPESEHLVNRAGSALVVGLAALPAIALVRALPMGRVTGAVALAGGYLAADRWVRETYASTRGARVTRSIDRAGAPAGASLRR